MPLDTLILDAVAKELQTVITGSSVQKVYEPSRKVIILNLYSQGQQHYLLLSFDAHYGRVHLTETRLKMKPSKEQPSPFCMLLRKYLIGGKVSSIVTPPLERIIEITFDPPDGFPAVKLIAELMGRRSNLILINNSKTILGAARTVSIDNNPYRAILPGEIYREAPGQNKLNPLEMEQVDFKEQFRAHFSTEGKTPEESLLKTVGGISPLIAREMIYRISGTDQFALDKLDPLYKALKELFYNTEQGLHKPLWYAKMGVCSSIRLSFQQQEQPVLFPDFNSMLDQCYTELIGAANEDAEKKMLSNAVQKRINSLKRKKDALGKDLQKAEKAPQYRIFGELLLTFGERVPRGAKSVELPNLYDPDTTVSVPLKPAETAAANAKRYFNLYRKAKTGREKVQKQLRLVDHEINYCQSILYSIETGNMSSLTEIRQELVKAGYLKNKQKNKIKTDSLPQPLSFKTSAGRTILVGRNNRQNDYVTFKAAVRRDIWFHIRQLPGSHVLLKETNWPPLEQDLQEAAFLAAFFSRGCDKSAVDIDYTEIRHVRRQPGGKPGLVYYDHYKTITANPLDPSMRKLFNLDKPL